MGEEKKKTKDMNLADIEESKLTDIGDVTSTPNIRTGPALSAINKQSHQHEITQWQIHYAINKCGNLCGAKSIDPEPPQQNIFSNDNGDANNNENVIANAKKKKKEQTDMLSNFRRKTSKLSKTMATAELSSELVITVTVDEDKETTTFGNT